MFGERCENISTALVVLITRAPYSTLNNAMFAIWRVVLWFFLLKQGARMMTVKFNDAVLWLGLDQEHKYRET